MTEDQRDSLLGIAFGFAMVTAAAAFAVFLLIDGVAQAAVYAGFCFIAAFIVLRRGLLVLARRIERRH